MKAALVSFLVLGFAAVSFGTGGVVQINIAPDPSLGYGPTPVIDRDVVDPYSVTGKAGIWWVDDVVVTGDNQGLAGWNVTITLTDMAGNRIWDPGTTPSSGDTWWQPIYKSAKQAGGTVKDLGGNGGPGMDVSASEGYGFEGQLAQCGSGHLDWKAFGWTGKAWTGEDTWGVGLASRKNVLLADPEGVYGLQGGFMPIPNNLPLGMYKLVLTVNNAAVLKSGSELNLNYPNNHVGGITMAVAGADLDGSEFVFQVVPEPATLLLLGVPALFLRRRR